MSEVKNLKDIKFGLIAVDPESLDENDNLSIAHFVGYWEEPSNDDAVSLKEELSIDEEFGLTEIAHRLEIYPAPDYVVEMYVGMLSEDKLKLKPTSFINEKKRYQELAGILNEGEEIETINTANKGDYIVKNPTGEEYVLTPSKFEKNYYTTPLDKSPDSKGYSEYKNKPEERSVVEVNSEVMNSITSEFGDNIPSQEDFFEFSKGLDTKKAEKSVTVKARVADKKEDVATITKKEGGDDDVFKFKASWGEDMIVKKGDCLVVSDSEVYRIGKSEFNGTYKFVKK